VLQGVPRRRGKACYAKESRFREEIRSFFFPEDMRIPSQAG